MMIMIKSNASNEDLDRQSISLRDVRSFSIIIFMVSLMTAAIINTQAGMKPIASVLAFFALANLIVGIAAQLIRMRK
jgi:small-conductance mechanosensitive channel